MHTPSHHHALPTPHHPPRTRIKKIVVKDSNLLTRLGLDNHRVALATLPWVILVLLIRLALELSPLDFTGIFAPESVTPFTTASMFVIAIILGGVLEDYKDAERIPADMVSALDSISEKLNFIELTTSRAAAKQERKLEQQKQGPAPATPAAEEEEIEVLDSAKEHNELLAYVTALFEYFAGFRGDQDIIGVTSLFSKYFAFKANEHSEVSKVEAWEVFEKFDELRASIHRMSVIKNTNFIPSGTSLMQVLVVATVALVALARYDNSAPDVPGGGGGRRLWADAEGGGQSDAEAWITENVSAYCNIGTCAWPFAAAFFSSEAPPRPLTPHLRRTHSPDCFLFIYVLHLIADLEDPFELTIYSLVPRIAPEGSTAREKKMLRAHAKGAADVDMYPFLELYLRVAAFAARHDILGASPAGRGSLHGIRPAYVFIDSHTAAAAPLALPSQLLAAAAKNELLVETEDMERRAEYRDLLMDAMHTALASVRDSHGEGSPSSKKKGGGGRGEGAASPLLSVNARE